MERAILSDIMRRFKFRKYSHRQAVLGVTARLHKILDAPSPDYPSDRQPGRITIDLNGQHLVIDLIPAGDCTQYQAVFNGVPWKIAGMKKIHAEIRRRMPPLRGY